MLKTQPPTAAELPPLAEDDTALAHLSSVDLSVSADGGLPLGRIGWLTMLTAGALATLWLVKEYLSSPASFTQPWFSVTVVLAVIFGGLCMQPRQSPLRFSNHNTVAYAYLLLTFLSVCASLIFAGKFSGYFALFYIPLSFISLYRFNQQIALVICVSTSLFYLLLLVIGRFDWGDLALNLAALWVSVAMYLLFYHRQLNIQRMLLAQVLRERRTRRQLEITSRLNSRLSTSLNLDELLHDVVTSAAQLVDVPYCTLQMCDLANNLLLMRNIFAADPALERELRAAWQGVRFGINQGLAGWVVQTGESVSVERAADDPRYVIVPGLEQVGEWSILMVPLVIKQRVLGVLGAASFARRHFSADERALLQSFASQAAVAIENATLVNELIERKVQLERSQAGLAAVLDVNRSMLAQRDYLAALQVIVDNLMSLIPFANYVIYNVEEGGYLRGVLAEGTDIGDALNDRFPMGDGITGIVAATGVAEMVNHAELDTRSAIILNTPADEVSSLLVAPLFVEGQVRGVIRLGRTGDWLFEADELELLKVFATQASLALENANLSERKDQIANDQSWMISLTQIMNSALDLEAQLQQVVHASVEWTEADFGALLLREPDGTLKVSAVSAPQDYLSVGQLYPIEPTPISEAFLNRREARLPGSLKGDVVDVYTTPPVAGRFRSQLAVPLIVGDELIGVLSIFSVQAAAFDRRFPEKLLPTFANQAAISIRNSQLFAELESRRRELEERSRALEISKRKATRSAEEQAMLFQISKIAVNARSLVDDRRDETEWLTTSLTLVKQALNVDKATLITLHKGQRELVALQGFSPDGEAIVRRNINNCDLQITVERDHRPAEVEDCRGRGGMLGLLATHEHVYNALAVPLMVGGQVIGVLTVYNKKAERDEQAGTYTEPTENQPLALPYLATHVSNAVNGNGAQGRNGSNGANGSNGTHLAIQPAATKGMASIYHSAFDRENRTTLYNMANALASGIENVRNYKSLSDTYFDSIRMLVDIMEAKDPYTKGHSEKVMVCALAIGEELLRTEHPEFKHDQMGRLLWAALLHDIGKLGIRDELLHLASRPGVEGFWVLASHTRIGAKILNNIEKLKQLAPLVQAHHERWDGQGYPDGLLNTEIPFISRIVTVADSFDAMTSDRDYQKKRSIEWAMEELERNAGTQFDPELVAIFLRILREHGDPRNRAVPEISPAIAPDWIRI